MSGKQFAAAGAEFQSDRASKAVKIANGSAQGVGVAKQNGQSSSKEKAPKEGKIAGRAGGKGTDQIKSSDKL